MPQSLTVIQFAWRLNGFFIFFISFVCSVNACNFSKIFKKRENIIFIMILMIASWIPIASLMGQIKNEDHEKSRTFEKILIDNTNFGVYNIVRDYMPDRAYLIRDSLHEREDKTIIVSGNAQILSENKFKLTDKIQIEVTEETEFELPYLYYLGYTTKINGEKITDLEYQITDKDYLDNTYIIIKRGKKNYYVGKKN